MGAIDVLLAIRAVSPELCELVADVLAEQEEEQGNPLGAQLVRDPGWVVRQAVGQHPDRVFAATLGGTLYLQQVDKLKLGKKTQKIYSEACELQDKFDTSAYGPPPVRFAEQDVDQARAAGVLLELDPIRPVLDRDLYRELARSAMDSAGYRQIVHPLPEKKRKLFQNTEMRNSTLEQLAAGEPVNPLLTSCCFFYYTVI